jgi:hypothetical protein
MKKILLRFELWIVGLTALDWILSRWVLLAKTSSAVILLKIPYAIVGLFVPLSYPFHFGDINPTFEMWFDFFVIAAVIVIGDWQLSRASGSTRQKLLAIFVTLFLLHVFIIGGTHLLLFSNFG